MTDKPDTVKNEESRDRRAMMAHVVPFAVWLAAMFLLPEQAWAYAVRTVLTLALLFWMCPWQWYDKACLKHFPLGVLAGALVFVIWVFPESGWVKIHAPGFSALYEKFLIIGSKELPEMIPYALENAGWSLTLIHLLGSALVIAVAEEFFWRGFIYRWLIAKKFLDVKISTLNWSMLLLAGVIFGFEHNRWFAGFIAGVVYTVLMVKTKNIWTACVAHITTNLLLGLYVLATGAYIFW